MVPTNRCSLAWLVFLVLVVALPGCTAYRSPPSGPLQKVYAVTEPAAPRHDDSAVKSVAEPLTIKAAIAIARKNNPDLVMAVARMGKAEALIGKANAAFYPGIGFYTEYLQGDAPSAYLFKTIDARRLPAQTNFNEPGWFENYETGITAGINLFNGGRDLLDKKMAETGRAVSEHDRRAVDNALVATVIRTFYNTLAAAKFIRTAEASVETVRSQLRIMKVRYDSGGALKSDILSLEVRLAEAVQAVVQSRNRHRISLAALADVLGIDPDAPLTIVEKEIAPPPVPEAYAAGMGFAMGHRPELARARDQLRRSRMAKAKAKSGYLPKVDFKTKYYADDEHMAYDHDRDNWTAGVFFNWQLFNGFQTKWDLHRANAVLAEMTAADRKTALSVKFDVKKAYLDLDEADQRLKVARSSVDTAEESLALVKKQYEGGSATITRYLEAELARNRARINADAAFYDRQKALAEIGRAIGYWHTTSPKAQGQPKNGPQSF